MPPCLVARNLRGILTNPGLVSCCEAKAWPHARTISIAIPISSHLSRRNDIVHLLSSARSAALHSLTQPDPTSLQTLAQPYPASSPDTSLFEDESTVEYSQAGAEITDILIATTPVGSPTACHHLRIAVQEKDVAFAQQILHELQASNIPIQKDKCYRIMAYYSLRHALDLVGETGFIREEAYRDFLTWWNMIPDYPVPSPGSTPQILAYLSRPQFEARHLMDFALVAANKGGRFGIIINIVTRLAPSVPRPTLLEFFTKLESSRIPLYVREAWTWRNHLLRTLCLNQRELDAAALLLAWRTQDDSFRVGYTDKRGFTAQTYRLVYHCLQSAEALDLRTSLEAAFQADHPSSTIDMSTLPPLKTIHQPATQSPTIASTASLLFQLRDSRNTELRGRNIADLAAAYTALGRRSYRGLLLLHKRTQRNMRTSWALAEMLYHRNRGDYTYVLKTFRRHFLLHGIPRDIFFKTVDGKKVPDGPARSPFPRITSGQKREAPPSGISIVIDVLVNMCNNLDSLRTLYQAYLNVVDKPPSLAAGVAGANQGVRRPEWRSATPVMFQPFIRSFTYHDGPDRALNVIDDMQARGVMPSVQNLTVILREYAYRGEWGIVIRILDLMENNGSTGGSSTQGGHRRIASTWPRPSLITYGAVLEALIHTGLLKQASTIRRRLIKAGYKRGSHRGVDIALEKLEMKGRRDSPA